MSKIPIKPQNLPETLVWYSIIYTYPIYWVGGHYILATFLATFFTSYLVKKLWDQTEETPPEEKITISSSVWVWIIAVLVIEFALIIGHIDFDLGLIQILKSTFIWYRNWGLFALFPLAGHLNIRPKILYRASCILCLHSIAMVIISYIAIVVHLPIIHLVSPLKAFGGVSDSYSIYFFYVLDENQPRLQLFAPWPPALGLVGNIYFFLAKQEIDQKWRWIGMVGAAFTVFFSVSRLAILCLPALLILVWLITNLSRPLVHFMLCFISAVGGIIAPTVIIFLKDIKDQFNQARAGSSEVRARLRRMAQDAWLNEAPIWGHGRLEEKGLAYVAFKPIGSHHAWFGVLYTHGIVGCAAFAVAFLWSVIDLLIKAQTYESSKVALSIILVLLVFTTAENIDTLAYISWPGLLMLGIGFKQGSGLSIANNQPAKTKKLSF